MINKETIRELVNGFTEGGGIFLVDVKVSATNKITVLADKPSGITIDECVALSRYIESKLDRDREDFELSVSSPGLNTPFRVKEQYEMSIGRGIEVTDMEGNKTTGILKNVQGEGFEIESTKKSKGKKKEIVEISFNFDDIKSVKEIIKFK